MLTPLGDRILVRPEANPETTESGLHLVEHRKPETLGEVVAVGSCKHPLRSEARSLAARLSRALEYWNLAPDNTELVTDAIVMLKEVTAYKPSVKVGDTVVFSWNVGQELQIDDARYLLMRESDVLAVLEGVTS